MQAVLDDIEVKGFKLYVVARGSKADLNYLTPLGHAVLLDPQGQASDAYKVRSIPQTYFVDRSGKICWGSLGWGPGSLDEFEAAVDDAAEGG